MGSRCIQFWTKDATEFANAFTYGGATLTQYPLTIFPKELMRSLTFVVPVAFVNWYPCLLPARPRRPLRAIPAGSSSARPVAAVLMVGLALLVWRTGVRRYTSTGP